MKRAAIVVLAGVLALLGGSASRAEEGAAGAGVYVYHVRIVRVDTPPEVVATPHPFGPAATTDLPWAETLAALGRRGHTTILMDHRVTTHRGLRAEASAERRQPTAVLVRRDDTNRTQQVTDVKSGAKAGLKPVDAGAVEYDVHVTFIQDPYLEGDMGPRSQTVGWRGSHGALPAGTALVLHAREQVVDLQSRDATTVTGPTPSAPPARGVEIYVFVGSPPPAER